MKLTSVQQFMLYALGTCYAELDERFSNKPVEITMSKVDFIDLIHKAEIVAKKDRAVYKNLESLEKLKLIGYNNKVIKLTTKGKNEYDKIKIVINPYIIVTNTLTSDDILKYTNRAQTVLK